MEKNQILESHFWQDFETRLKGFSSKMPVALKKKGIEDYAAKLFSYVKDDILCVCYKIYYKENGHWVEHSTLCNFEEFTVPTWATKGLSADEVDVTARYEKYLQINI